MHIESLVPCKSALKGIPQAPDPGGGAELWLSLEELLGALLRGLQDSLCACMHK